MVHGRNLLSAAIAALVLSAPLSGQQPGAAPTSVTLADALKRAQQVAPSVVTAEGSVQTADLAIRSAQWSFLPALTVQPSMNLSLSNGQSRLDPITGEIISGNVTTPTYVFGASATYTIFDGFARNYNLKQQRSNQASANASLVTNQYASDFTTTQAFFSALQANQQLAVSQSNVDLAQSQLALAAAKLHAGAGTLSDSLAALGSLLTARLGLLTARNNVVVTETNLGRLVGVAGRVAAIDDSAYYRTMVTIDTAAIRHEALSNAPVIVSATAAVDAAQQSYRASRAGYLPTLSASAAQSWTGNWADPSPPSSSSNSGSLISRRSLNITLSINPWTSLTRETTISNAAIRITNAEATLADTRNLVAAQLNQAFAALSTAQETISVAAAAFAAGQENLRVVTERYRNGAATITEMLTAQQQMITAQTNQVTSRYTYLNAKAQLEQVLGRKL